MNFDKLHLEINQMHHFKDKIIIETKLRKQTAAFEPRLPGHMSKTVTNGL